jgi:hypothetical protein
MHFKGREWRMDSKLKHFGGLRAGLVALAGGIAALAVAPRVAQASIVSGSISFYGNVTPYLDTTGTGTVATDFQSAHSLVFGTSYTAASPTGSFSGIAENSPVTMSLIQFNPPQLPAAAIWTVGSYSFTLSTMTEPVDQPDFLVLTGAGILSDGVPADDNTGVWIATFTTVGGTYSWNSSFNSIAVPEPLSAGTLVIAGAGLLARRKRTIA